MKWSFFISKKSEIGTVVEKVLEKIKVLNMQTKYLCCDYAGENGKQLNELCTKMGI